MKKTLAVKLIVDKTQESALLKTTTIFREVCKYVSEKAFEDKVFNQIALHDVFLQGNPRL
jgi:predicted transposase